MMALKGWISICPDVMHEVPLFECEKCRHHRGYSRNGDIRKVVCEYEWEQIPLPLRPLFRGVNWNELRVVQHKALLSTSSRLTIIISFSL